MLQIHATVVMNDNENVALDRNTAVNKFDDVINKKVDDD